MPSREELAWAAGLFEGEGYIGMSRVSPAMSLASTDEDVVQKFNQVVGLGRVCGPYTYTYTYRKKSKPIWVWRAGGFTNVQAIGALLWFKLCDRRRTKIQDVLLKARINRVRRKTHAII